MGTQKVVMPFVLEPGDYIVNRGSETYLHYSENHKIKNEVVLDGGGFTLNKSENLIEFDYTGKGRVAGPEMIVNFCTKI